MAQLVSGTFDQLEHAVFGVPHANTLNFLQNQFDAAYSAGYNTSAILGQATANFIEKSRNLFDKVNGSEAVRLAKAAARKINSLWLNDDIQVLSGMGSFQHAPTAMQRWLMTDPVIRELYIKQRCDGYSNSYVNLDGNAIGVDHYDWRRANEGLINLDESDDPDDAWRATTYIEDLRDGDRELDLPEKIMIQRSIENMHDEMLRSGEDPTSIFNADL